MMLLVESGTLPHRPWTTMSLVNGRTRKRSAAGGWSEAEVCAEEVAAPLEPLRGDSPREPVTPSRGNCQQERRTAPSGSSYRQGRRKAPSGSNSTAQSKAPSGEQPAEPAALGHASCRTAHREATPQRKARHLREEQPAEPAASGSGCFGK